MTPKIYDQLRKDILDLAEYCDSDDSINALKNALRINRRRSFVSLTNNIEWSTSYRHLRPDYDIKDATIVDPEQFNHTDSRVAPKKRLSEPSILRIKKKIDNYIITKNALIEALNYCHRNSSARQYRFSYEAIKENIDLYSRLIVDSELLIS